jgi:hypothetical protein
MRTLCRCASADGRKVTVKGGWHGLPEEQGFLRDVQAAACEQFTTVLGVGLLRRSTLRRPSGRL